MPPIRKDLFHGNVWNGLVSRKRLERTYFANAFGKDVLISQKRLERKLETDF